MRKILNRLISKLKGEKYVISDEIPLLYFIHIILRRLIMLVRGSMTICKKDNYFFRGPKVKMYCNSKIFLKKGVSISRGCYLDALSTNGIVIGKNSSMGKYTVIECSGSLKDLGKGILVGDNVSLGANGFFGCAGGIEIGDNTIMGNFVSFHSENHVFSSRENPIRNQGVTREGIIIGKDCWIGAKVTILDGVIVEDGCIIAAGALLAKGKYEAFGVYGGIPAKLLKSR